MANVENVEEMVGTREAEAAAVTTESGVAVAKESGEAVATECSERWSNVCGLRSVYNRRPPC